ncbi:MAG TPA: proline dehydrogenase family protein [Methanotrichaceae archaeon]|nr:proline dehydrogenase family protein [Methanotrichaceae archaeon]
MDEAADRWALPDWQSALMWCRYRNKEGIRCIIDVLGENARDESQAALAVRSYTSVAKSIRDQGLKASITIKLTALGASFDMDLCLENVMAVQRAAADNQVCLEIDMEGTPIVDCTLEAALACAEVSPPVTLAVQAYLDRTALDLERLSDSGVRPRLVKGTYLGDTSDFQEIQERFKSLFGTLINAGRQLCVGTHDPQLLDWITDVAADDKDLIELGFLKGLADETKLDLAGQGWSVAEYLPFGLSRVAYEARRRRYLKEIDRMGRFPAP